MSSIIPTLTTVKFSTLLLLMLLQLWVVSAQYQFTREYSGTTFFDRWQFYNNCKCVSAFVGSLAYIFGLFHAETRVHLV